MKSTIDLISLKKRGQFVFLLPLIVGAFLFAQNIKAQQPDRPPEADEINYYPGEGEVTASNPPPFMWLPAENVSSYFIQYSGSASFEPGATKEVSGLTITVHTPTEVMQPGTWYWRYGFDEDEKRHYSKTRSFVIPQSAVAFPFVPVDEVISRIPKERPRLHFSPELVKEIRSDTQGRFDHITGQVINEANDILEMEEPLFEEPKMWDEYDDPDAAYVNAWRSMRPYTQRMVTSALAYLYTGDLRFARLFLTGFMICSLRKRGIFAAMSLLPECIRLATMCTVPAQWKQSPFPAIPDVWLVL